MKKLIATLLIAFSSLPVTAETRLSERERAAHALNRLAFGARPGDIERVTAMGADRWIEQQLRPERISDGAVDERLKQFPTFGLSEAEIVEKFYQPIVKARRDKEESVGMLRREAQQVMSDLTSQRIIRAVDSERQLNEVMVDFWMNHFNVFAGKGIDRFLLTSFERDTIRPNIWGRFEDLLMATAKSPAMLFYLDNARSVAAPENRRTMNNMNRGGLNENYAREIMELHTLGVDGGYTQKDVTELARVLTGWGIARPQENKSGFVFRRNLHDAKEKTVLGVKFPAGGGIEEGETMIRVLAAHPSTAKHIARKLVSRLVSDDPPPALVDRVAKRFLDTKGDLRETVRAVVTSSEFWSPKYYRAKVKSPFEYTMSAVRAVGGKVENARPLARELQKMGQPLYYAQPPTGYSDRAETWVNSGALINRLNFAMVLAGNKMPGVRATVPASPDAIYAIAGADLSPQTRKTIEARGTTDPASLAALVLGSPEFQQQ